jgi:hypothetical protein
MNLFAHYIKISLKKKGSCAKIEKSANNKSTANERGAK